MKFSKYSFDEDIQKALIDLGYHKTTDIQYRVIPAVLNGEDVLAIAQTGTGKTAAFAIPIIEKIYQSKKRNKHSGVKCLVMVPTRELATQIRDVFDKIAKYTTVHAAAIVGGVDQDPQIAKLKLGTDIVISTPGRMFDLIAQGHLKLDQTETLILDEADLMLDLGFFGDIEDVMKHLPNQRQTLFFSATINKDIKKLAYQIVRNPIRIELSPNDPVSKNIEHWKLNVNHDDKRFFLERLIKERKDDKVMVFVRTRVRSERVQKAMERVEIDALVINGEMEQSDRKAALNAFKEGTSKILIATDVTARGIDIPDVDVVVNYDLPEDPEYYVHRIGRTGRGRNKGQAYSFISENDDDVLKEIETFISYPIRTITIDDGFYNEIKITPDEEKVELDDIMNLIEEHENRKPKPKKRKKK